MTVATSSNFPDHPVLLHFKEELHKKPADFEKIKRLYYVAAVISSLVATAFFLSFIPLQTMMLPFWLSIAGTIVAQSVGGLFVKVAGDMVQNAQEVGKIASDLKEMQNTYQRYQGTSLSEPEKIIMAHGNHAEKEYAEAEQSLQELIENTNSSNLQPRLEEIIQLQYQVLLLKIDVCFKAATFDIVSTGNFNYLLEKKDLFSISNQDPLTRSLIQKLHDSSPNKFKIEPLIFFKKIFNFDTLFGSSENFTDDYSETLSYDAVIKMIPEDLTNHIFTFMTNPL